MTVRSDLTDDLPELAQAFISKAPGSLGVGAPSVRGLTAVMTSYHRGNNAARDTSTGWTSSRLGDRCVVICRLFWSFSCLHPPFSILSQLVAHGRRRTGHHKR